jgi:hypothetical protein
LLTWKVPDLSVSRSESNASYPLIERVKSIIHDTDSEGGLIISTGAALTASESAKHDPALIAIVKALARAAAARDYVASRETEQSSADGHLRAVFEPATE